MHLSWVLSLLLGVWAVLFYVTLTDEIDHETDEVLENRAEAIIKRVLAEGVSSDTALRGDRDYDLTEVSEEYVRATATKSATSPNATMRNRPVSCASFSVTATAVGSR